MAPTQLAVHCCHQICKWPLTRFHVLKLSFILLDGSFFLPSSLLIFLRCFCPSAVLLSPSSFLLSMMKLPCLPCLLGSLRPARVVLWNFRQLIWFHLLLCVCSQHPVGTRSFLWGLTHALLMPVFGTYSFVFSQQVTSCLFPFHCCFSLVSSLPCSLDPL